MGGQEEERERSVAGPLASTAGQDLVRELRRMKATSGLSFARLGTKTPYSRASLERYVNSKLFPSRHAVGEIARACGADPTEALRLWDAAVVAEAPVEAVVETAVDQRPALVDRRIGWRRRTRLAVMALALAVLVLALNTGAAPRTGSAGPASADGCRDYLVEIRVYTVGRMCWTAKDATVSGYLINPTEPGPGLVQLCISNKPNSCFQVVDLATANTGQQVRYQQTVGLPSGYGIWIRTCLSGYCTWWK